MAVSYKDIDELAQKAAVDGNEKLPVSDTEYITPAQIVGGSQPLDADLTAIAGLPGASGVLKKTAADTWALDTDTFYTSANANKIDAPWACSSLSVVGALQVNRLNPDAANNTSFTLTAADQLADIAILDKDDWYSKLTFTLQSAVRATLDVNGNFTATGTITPGSDSRIKDDQQEIDCKDAIEIVERLTPKTWKWNDKAGDPGKKAAGLVAQEVKEIIPEAVVVSDMGGFKDFHALNYNTIQGYELAAIKGLISEVKTLRAEIEEFKNKK